MKEWKEGKILAIYSHMYNSFHFTHELLAATVVSLLHLSLYPKALESSIIFFL